MLSIVRWGFASRAAVSYESEHFFIWEDVHIYYRKLCFLPEQKEIEGGAYYNGFYSFFLIISWSGVNVKFFWESEPYQTDC